MSYDAIVIGGGINGLVAAATMARKGKKICLLEQSDQLGGMAAPGVSSGSRMAHLLWNLSPAVRRDVGMDPHKWPFAQTKIPTVSLDPNGAHVVLHGTSPVMADGTSHPDNKACRKLLSRLTNYGEILRRLADGAPPGLDAPIASMASLKEIWRLAQLGKDLKRLDKAEFRRFLQVLLSNAFDLILDEMPDGPLAGMLAADAVRGAAAGPRSPGTVFNLIYRLGHGGRVSLPDDGMGAVIDAFADAALRAGVDVKSSTGVARVLIEGDAVTGVETTAGDILYAPLVLSSTGALSTARLVGVGPFDIEATRRLRNVRARGTAAKINFTVSSPVSVPGTPHDLGRARLVYAPSADYVERAFNPSKYKEMSEAPVIEAVMTDDTTLSTIVQYAPVDLNGGWTDAARAKLRDIVVSTLAQAIPALPDQIVSSEVITPDQIEAETGAPGGHWHHAEMSLDQLLALRPANGMGRYAMGPRGLYLCGASAHPGGDIMGLSGRNAALAAVRRRA